MPGKTTLYPWGDESLTISQIAKRVPYSADFVRRAVKGSGVTDLAGLTRLEAESRAKRLSGSRKSTHYLENQIVYSTGPRAILAIRRQRKWCVPKPRAEGAA